MVNSYREGDASVAAVPPPIDHRIETLRQMRQEELSRARAASVLVGVDDPITTGQQGADLQGGGGA